MLRVSFNPNLDVGGWGRGRQGLIQKEKVHIDCEKGAQISILANKIVTH